MNRAKFINGYRLSTASNLGAINRQIVVINKMTFKITKVENGYNVWIENKENFICSVIESNLVAVRKTIATYKQYA